ncbi:hypothetical protein BCR44DRAFT_1125464 [Catenaria anguillulae PL171]|uniref:Uncharacterized protein n=1 Tax=Catenaria anguillulae PL171 TaxID=765915 RepID=A0A1Y2HKZ7_9FUNG|nr:hypothetical protein BCR44DRAFT_1125464 [Catenaria anguillulae PL171]
MAVHDFVNELGATNKVAFPAHWEWSLLRLSISPHLNLSPVGRRPRPTYSSHRPIPSFYLETHSQRLSYTFTNIYLPHIYAQPGCCRTLQSHAVTHTPINSRKPDLAHSNHTYPPHRVANHVPTPQFNHVVQARPASRRHAGRPCRPPRSQPSIASACRARRSPTPSPTRSRMQ